MFNYCSVYLWSLTPVPSTNKKEPSWKPEIIYIYQRRSNILQLFHEICSVVFINGRKKVDHI
jgi:hypothetical protein